MASVELTLPERALATGAAVGVVSFPPALEENSYQRLLYEALSDHGYELVEGHLKLGWLLRNRRRARVLHFHWPWNYYRDPTKPRGPKTWIKLPLFAVRLAVARALGYRIAWTVHEVLPLDTSAPEVDRLGARLLGRMSHVLLANDPETAAKAADALGRAAEVVPHSSYVGVYPEGRTRAQMRAELGIGEDAPVFLLFGHVSVYKHVPWFVGSFRAAELPDDAALIVAGLVVDEAGGEAVRAAAAEDPRIKPLLGFIPDEAVSELFAAADVAISPRMDGGTSGVLMLALSMGVAPLTARVETYEALTGGEAAAWLFEPHDRDSLIAALERAAGDPEGTRARSAEAHARVADLSWDGMGRRIGELFDAAGRR